MKRLIPTDKEWYNYKENKYCAWLFSFMVSCANYNKQVNDLYYTKSQYKDDMQSIKRLCGVSNKRTIDRYKNKLLELGYITEDENCYHIINHTDMTYILIDKDLLYNICTTKSTLTIQIFVYLLERMNMKKKVYSDSKYNFTIKEVQSMLGYTSNSQNNNLSRAIVECIQTLKAEEYIDYNIVYVESDNNNRKQYKIPNYQLVYICEKLPTAIQQIKKAETAIKENKASTSNKLDKDFIF